MNKFDFVDDQKKVIYEKELKIAYYTKYPNNTDYDFLEMLIKYANSKKGYRIKDKRLDRIYSEEIEKMLHEKLLQALNNNE